MLSCPKLCSCRASHTHRKKKPVGVRLPDTLMVSLACLIGRERTILHHVPSMGTRHGPSWTKRSKLEVQDPSGCFFFGPWHGIWSWTLNWQNRVYEFKGVSVHCQFSEQQACLNKFLEEGTSKATSLYMEDEVLVSVNPRPCRINSCWHCIVPKLSSMLIAISLETLTAYTSRQTHASAMLSLFPFFPGQRPQVQQLNGWLIELEKSGSGTSS